jgi:hypothetical protein
MNEKKTWVDYLVITVVVAFILVGLAAIATVAAFAFAMNNFGSNK